MKKTKSGFSLAVAFFMAFGVLGGCNKKAEMEWFLGDYTECTKADIESFYANVQETNAHLAYLDANTGVEAQCSMQTKEVKKEDIIYEGSVKANLNTNAVEGYLKNTQGEQKTEERFVNDATYVYVESVENGQSVKNKEEWTWTKEDLAINGFESLAHGYDSSVPFRIVHSSNHDRIIDVLGHYVGAAEKRIEDLNFFISHYTADERTLQIEKERLSKHKIQYAMDSTDESFTKIQISFTYDFNIALRGGHQWHTGTYTWVYTKDYKLVAYKNETVISLTKRNHLDYKVDENGEVYWVQEPWIDTVFTYSAIPWSGTITLPKDLDSYIVVDAE